MGAETIRVAACRCGHVALELRDEPILTVVCHCTSCQAAAERLQALPGAAPMLDADGGTEFTMFRKDRANCLRGGDMLREHRLDDKTTTRRVVAACCNSPMFLEFSGGHWLSIYRARLPDAERPPLDMRVMTRERRAGVEFTDGLPGYGTHSVRFMWLLLTAWAAMKFRAPKLDYIRGGVLEA